MFAFKKILANKHTRLLASSAIGLAIGTTAGQLISQGILFGIEKLGPTPSEIAFQQNAKIKLELDCPAISQRDSLPKQFTQANDKLSSTQDGHLMLIFARDANIKLCDTSAQHLNAEPNKRTAAAEYSNGTITYHQPAKTEQNDLNDLIIGAHELFHHFQDRSDFIYKTQLRLVENETRKFHLYTEAAAHAFHTRVIFEYISQLPPSEYSVNGENATLYNLFKYTYAHLTKGGLDKDLALNKATQEVFEFYLESQTTEDNRLFYLKTNFKKSSLGLDILKHYNDLGDNGQLTYNEVMRVTTLPNGFQLYAADHLPSDQEFAVGLYIPKSKDTGSNKIIEAAPIVENTRHPS